MGHFLAFELQSEFEIRASSFAPNRLDLLSVRRMMETVAAMELLFAVMLVADVALAKPRRGLCGHVGRVWRLVPVL
jgi:hypothetical protein